METKPFRLIHGFPALLPNEIEAIQMKGVSLDVLVVGINPSLSRKTYKQLYRNLVNREDETEFLSLLDDISTGGGKAFKRSVSSDGDWNEWVRQIFGQSQFDIDSELEEKYSALQYFFVEGRKKPSIDAMSWPSLHRKADLSSRNTIIYYDTIRQTLAGSLEAIQSRELDRQLNWFQIDLFHDRETSQTSFLDRIKDGNRWSPYCIEAVNRFWERVERLNPKVLLIANSTVSDLIFTNYDAVLKETFRFGGGPKTDFGKNLYWDETSFSIQIDRGTSARMPQVVFSRQLSGGASNAMKYYVAKEIGRALSLDN